MPPWTLTETDPTEGRTFQRPPDPPELRFIWSSRVDGRTDSLHHVELRLLNASQDAHLFSDTNIIDAWLSTKRRHPLAGATIQVLPPNLNEAGSKIESDNSPPTVPSEHFLVVKEHDLAVVRPHEIVFGYVACADDVQKQLSAILNAPRSLSDDLLVQLYVFRETDTQRSDILHLVPLIAHCVSDGMGNRTFMRCLLDTLARGGEPDLQPAQVPLEERLAMLIPATDLKPIHLRSLSPAIRRWRQAVGTVIFRLRMSKFKGGHTLPCRRTRTTPFIPPRPGSISTLLTEEQTTTVLTNCRLYGVTFGSAYLALAQVAMTRVLYRRYLRGEISDEEWEYRKRQPHFVLGPVNLRPYLDESWYQKGGGGEFMLSVYLCHYRLPFMTLGRIDPQQYREQELSDGAPPFSDLLTFDRFLLRAGLVKKQAKAFVRHPLLFEVIHAEGLGHAQEAQRIVQKCDVDKANGTVMYGDDDEVLADTDMPSVITYMGSTLGNVDLISPTKYPLPPTHPLSPFSLVPHPSRAGYVEPALAVDVDTTPRVVMENVYTSRLHIRPGSLYLGTLTSRGRLSIYISYDGNVYEAGVAREWLDEVKEAVLWYLCQTHQSH